jgi:hypothetical protein
MPRVLQTDLIFPGKKPPQKKTQNLMLCVWRTGVTREDKIFLKEGALLLSGDLFNMIFNAFLRITGPSVKTHYMWNNPE